MPQPSEHEIEVFNVALELPAGERTDYLDRVCAGDAALRQRVEGLLKANDESCACLEASTAALPGPDGTIRLLSIPAEKTGDRIGRYKLLQQIGEGGCGVVYMAEQEEPVRRRVALKVIKLGMDTKSVIARFEAERQALALMDHPNIAKVLDAGATETGRPYFVMELVRGVKITDYCDQNNLSTRERLDLFIQVCQAIQHAHQKGIIHRDIKPSNILVTTNDGVAVPKVIDFGIAKATQGRLTDHTLFTAFEQFLGTPAYMSPEQTVMTSLDIDTRSDIYSLGVLLYELLTSKTPFDPKELRKAGLDEIRRTIREEEPARPSTRLSTMLGADLEAVAKNRKVQPPGLISLVRGDLDWIVMKALEKDRGRRYETANGLAMDIKRHLNNEAVIARPPGSFYRFQKMVRRNKLLFAAASAVALALLAGLAISTWALLRERKAHASELSARRIADEQRQQAEASAFTAQEQTKRAETREAEKSRFLYVANMNLAQPAWEQNNIGKIDQLLNETQSFPDRGFEWYYWQRQTHLALLTLRGHSESVYSVAFSPDGQRIATGSADQTAKVWDAASGRELLTLKAHGQVFSVAFSPDGQRIATCNWDKTAAVRDAATGRELLTFRGHTEEVRSVAFSPDGQRIVTGSSDKTAKVWDAASGRELLTLKGHNHTIRSVAFSPDGQRIFTGCWDTAKVWDSASGRELLSLTPAGRDAWIGPVAFSPDGQQIITGDDDNRATVWDAASGRQLLTLLGHTDPVSSIAVSPDGQRIVTGSWDRTAAVYEINKGKDSAAIRQTFVIKGHIGKIYSVSYSPDGRRIATAGEDGTAKVWNAASDQEPLSIKRDGGAITAVAFSPDGQRIATGGQDQAKLWEVASGRQLLTFDGHKKHISSLAFSPDGQRVVTGAQNEAKVWEAASGRQLLTLEGFPGVPTKNWRMYWIESVAFSPDGQRIVTGAQNEAKVWEAASGRQLLSFKGHNDKVVSVAFSPDGQRIVTGSDDHTAKVWDAATGRELLTLKGHNGGVSSVAFSPDGQRIATGSQDGMKIWQAATKEQVAKWQAEEAAPVQY